MMEPLNKDITRQKKSLMVRYFSTASRKKFVKKARTTDKEGGHNQQ